MPFPEQEPRPFTKENIELLSPGQTGCYGIFNAQKWIYVGKGDIRDRMLKHVNGDIACIRLSGATHWVNVLANGAAMDEREKSLILELTPCCNQRVG